MYIFGHPLPVLYTPIIAVNSDYIPEFHTCKLPHSGLKTGCNYAIITRPLPAVYYVETSWDKMTPLQDVDFLV